LALMMDSSPLNRGIAKMRKLHVLTCAAFIALAGFSGPASAAPGFLPHTATLRAGPGSEYPPVARIPAGAGVDIHGCVAGWSWCDVNAGGLRGWVYGPSLAPSAYGPYPAQGIAAFGPALGLSFVLFNQDDYWGRYYRDRPFYATFRARNFHRDATARPAAFRAGATRRDRGSSAFMTTRARSLQAIRPAAGTTVRATRQPKLSPRNVSSHGGAKGGRSPHEAPRHDGKRDNRNR
jgi:uncharacterized protein YraI